MIQYHVYYNITYFDYIKADRNASSIRTITKHNNLSTRNGNKILLLYYTVVDRRSKLHPNLASYKRVGILLFRIIISSSSSSLLTLLRCGITTVIGGVRFTATVSIVPRSPRQPSIPQPPAVRENDSTQQQQQQRHNR